MHFYAVWRQAVYVQLRSDWQGEWLLLFNYLIPFSELLDQSGQALDCEGGGARVNIKTEQVKI